MVATVELPAAERGIGDDGEGRTYREQRALRVHEQLASLTDAELRRQYDLARRCRLEGLALAALEEAFGRDLGVEWWFGVCGE